MDHQKNRRGYFFRMMLAVGLTWLVLTIQGLAMRALHRIDLEMVVTIVVVTFIASLVAGAMVAIFIRKNLLAMVVISQLIGIALVGFVARV